MVKNKIKVIPLSFIKSVNFFTKIKKIKLTLDNKLLFKIIYENFSPNTLLTINCKINLINSLKHFLKLIYNINQSSTDLNMKF